MSDVQARSPFLRGNYAPVAAEVSSVRLPVVGCIPKALSGTLYRNGSNPQFAPVGEYHWFYGDGMIHAFHVHDGSVDYLNRWARTPKWTAENSAGQSLFAAFGNPVMSDPRVAGIDSGVANTNVVWFGDRLMALEESHRPFLLDPTTLDSNGYLDMRADLERFTAHPKVDPVTGELLFFGYKASGPLSPDIDYGVMAPDGTLASAERFAGPFCAMMHDFIVTENYVIFPVMPLTGRMERIRKGQSPWAWEPEAGTHVGILRRGSPVSDMRWFGGDACYVFHFMNAFEDGDALFIDGFAYNTPPFFPLASGERNPDETSRLERWQFDLGDPSKPFVRQPVGTFADELHGDFPRINDRFAGLPYRYGYFASQPNDRRSGMFSGLTRVDMISGEQVTYWLPDGDAMSEAVFVPNSPDAEEDDGWLAAVIFRGAENRSDFAVFDARDVTAGPIGIAKLDTRVPFGFHGNWRSGMIGTQG